MTATSPVRSATSCIIAVDAPLPDAARARLRAMSDCVRLVEGLEPPSLAQADVVFLGKGTVDPSAAPRLRWVQYNSAGIAALGGTPLARSGVPVATASGAYSTTVAELALALLLALLRQLPRCLELQQQRTWRADVTRLYGRSLRESTVGILGYGSIGREIARLVRGLGARVVACKRDPEMRAERARFVFPGTGDPHGEIPEAWYAPRDTSTMLQRCDALVVTLPGTRGTEKLLSREALAALPTHAVLVNVGRGAVIDEAALIEALRAGRIAGAGLDVFVEEPLPATHPWWTTPGVVITPHIASATLDQPDLAAAVLIENVRRDLAGEPLVNVADFSLGY